MSYAPTPPPPPPGYAPPPFPGQPYYAPPPKKHGPLYWIAVAIGIIVLVVIILVIAAVAFDVSTSVTVTGVNYTSSDNACGTSGNTGPGFHTVGSGAVTDTLTVSGGLFLSCTISSVTATTSGFSVTGANVPLTVHADQSADLGFTIHAPSSSFSGVLTIDIE